MRKKITVILISILSAFIIMSSGYGLWQKKLTVTGTITLKQDPDDIKVLNQQLIEARELEALRIAEELKLAEEVRVAEEARLAAVQRSFDLQNKLEQSVSPIVAGDNIQPIEAIVDGVVVETKNEVEQPTETIVEEEIIKDDHTQEEKVVKGEVVEEKEEEKENDIKEVIKTENKENDIKEETVDNNSSIEDTSEKIQLNESNE